MARHQPPPGSRTRETDRMYDALIRRDYDRMRNRRALTILVVSPFAVIGLFAIVKWLGWFLH